jgi:methylenetetrahydrofolate reductase (NADPH)
MRIDELLKLQPTTFSFEFFPPKSEQAAGDLFAAIADLEPLKPSFVSVTYGAGGSTRELTHALVTRLRRETPLNPMPHLTCVGHNEGEIASILERYAQAGIVNIMALRGDRPKDTPAGTDPFGAFKHATALVAFIRAFNERHRSASWPGFSIGVAGYPEGHPETPNRLREIENLKAKVEAGADFIVTQLFFDNRDFYDFRDRCSLAGVRVPMIAGIMPVTSRAGMNRMADLALGARFPAPLIRALNRAGDDAAFQRVGVHWATEQCRDLLDHHIAGLHFYTLNRSTATREVYATLGVKDSAGLLR